MRKINIINLISFIIISMLFISCQIDYKKESKPNVIFILVDDLGWNDLGYSGSTFYESPNIDSLSNNSGIAIDPPELIPSTTIFMSIDLIFSTGIISNFKILST